VFGTARNIVIVPLTVIRPMLPVPGMVNHSAPSGPGVMNKAKGDVFGMVGRGNSVMVPVGVILPIFDWVAPGIPGSVNRRLPSEPAAMLCGRALAVGIGNSVIVPLVVMRPILLPVCSTNHRLPSGPSVISCRLLFAAGTGNSVTVCAPALI
jgi:hypothetical protein